MVRPKAALRSGAVAACFATRRDWLAGATAALACSSLSRPVSAAAIRPLPRIAALDWAAAETLLALGISPVAIGDAQRFRAWFPEARLPATCIDLGSPNEPDVERLLTAAPDLILLSSWAAFNRPILETIAPTETVELYGTPQGPYESSLELLRQWAARTDRQHLRDLIESDAAETFTASRQMPAGGSSRSVAVLILNEDGRHATIYGKGSLIDEVIDRLGYINAWRAARSQFGNVLIGIEQLATIPEAMIVYLDQGSRTERAIRRLGKSTLWQNLNVVRTGQLVRMPAFYPHGGLPTAVRIARLFGTALAARSHGGT